MTKRKQSIPALCARVVAIDAAHSADLAAVKKATTAARRKLKIPAAISPAALATNPDLRTLSQHERALASATGYIRPVAIVHLIVEAKAGKAVEILSDDATGLTIRSHKKPLPPTADDLARATRLNKLLTIAGAFYRQYKRSVDALDIACEKRIAKRDDKAIAIEREIIATPSKSPADLLAKVKLYRLDPSRFDGAPARAKMNLPQSIIRDVPRVLAKGNGAASLRAQRDFRARQGAAQEGSNAGR